MTHLNIGDPAPAFTLVDFTGEPVRLGDCVNCTLIVYFYPAAMTPGCTLQAIDFSAAKEDFAKAGYEIIGISPDQPEKLARFRQKEDLSITLLADPTKETLRAYGAWGTKKLYGKEVEGVIRSTFIVDVDADGNGVIKQAQYNVRASGHVEKLLKELSICP